MASLLRVTYGDDFEFYDSKSQKIPPTTHGHEFAKTYNHDLKLDMAEHVL